MQLSRRQHNPCHNRVRCVYFLSEQDKSKIGEVRPETGHESPEGEWRYSSTLSSTSALGGVGGQRYAPASLPPSPPPERGRVPIVQEAGCVPGSVWMVAENLAVTGIRSPDRPMRSLSLYRLLYPGLHKIKGLFERANSL